MKVPRKRTNSAILLKILQFAVETCNLASILLVSCYVHQGGYVFALIWCFLLSVRKLTQKVERFHEILGQDTYWDKTQLIRFWMIWVLSLSLCQCVFVHVCLCAPVSHVCYGYYTSGISSVCLTLSLAILLRL